MKPTLDLYIGNYVAALIQNDAPNHQPWQWGIQLDNGVVIYNKDRRETFVPEDITGARIKTISYSEGDTTITFSNGHKWSLTPTQYSIADPRHGGEVYPQWPEELEEAGIPSHPEEDVSSPPSEGWGKERAKIVRVQHARHKSEAQEFLAKEETEDGS